MRRSSRTAAALVAGALAVSLAACGGSSGGGTTPTSQASHSSATNGPLADYSSLTGGSTVVTLTTTFEKELSALGVAPAAVAPAALTGTKVSFPIAAGSATVYPKGTHTPLLTGSVRHTGGLQLTAQGKNVAVKNFVLTLGATPTLAGTVLFDGQSLGGSTTTLFELDPSAVREAKSGSTTTLSNLPVYVASTAASALNLAFGLSGTKALPTTAHAIEVGTATITLEG